VYKFISVFFILLCSLSIARGQSVAISLSNDSAQLNYSLLVGGQRLGRSEFGAGILFNEDNYLTEVSLQVNDEAGSKAPGLIVGVGTKLYGAKLSDQEIMALAIGMMFRYSLPNYERFAVQLDGYYAPKIVSFLDANNFGELGLRFEYEVLPQAAAYVEYRQFTTDVDKGSEDVDKGVRAGIRFSF